MELGISPGMSLKLAKGPSMGHSLEVGPNHGPAGIIIK